MEQESSSILVRTSAPTASSKEGYAKRWFSLERLSYCLVGVWAITAATAAGFNIGLEEQLERQIHTLFFELRGPVEPPQDIVILTIDDASLEQGQFYQTDPEQYAAMAPIQAWPWQRQAYAIAIDNLMQAGAQAVGVDVTLPTVSSYGNQDDLALAQVLRQYGSHVVLASNHTVNISEQGRFSRWNDPLPQFRDQGVLIGSINMPVSADGRVHQFGREYLNTLPSNEARFEADETNVHRLTFAEAILKAAGKNYARPKGSNIFFYGPYGSFEHVPFWYVLDPNAWKSTLQNGRYFQDKIVLIGSTATIHQDFHNAPFSGGWASAKQLAGVEIQANAIATLLEGRTIAHAFSSGLATGGFVLSGVAIAGFFIRRFRQPMLLLAYTSGLVIAWIGAGYVVFTYGQQIIPVAVPALAITITGISQLTLGAVKEQIRKQQLRQTLKHYAALPIIQEIISQQDDLQDLLLEREAAIFGKVLGNRYKVVKVLGTGGFSETYVAEDTQRPSNPPCVVKQLRLISDKPNMLRLMRRLFIVEAETLERLGLHDQIPQLLAYFEEDQEFYLVQELIMGRSLRGELLPNKPMMPSAVIEILYDLLVVLEFVHGQGVIHRDIKPVNIIRRESDRRLVLIDFGIAKKLSTQISEFDPETKFTIGLGTQGYMPSEQAAGMPHYNSDLYALGMTAIEALTGISPHQLRRNDAGELRWPERSLGITPEFERMLRKMVHHDYTQRYQSAQENLTVLKQLPEFAVREVYAGEYVHSTDPDTQIADLDEALADLDVDTRLWQSE